MRGRPKRRNKKEQHSNAGKQHKPHACRAAVDAEVLALRQALQSAKKTNQKLASLNTNLRKQVKEFTRMEISWVEEKGKLVHENRSIQRTLGRKYIHARNEISRLEGILKVAETNKAFRKKDNKRPQAALNEIKAEGDRWGLREEEITTELKEMREKCQEQEEVIMKKEKLITRFRSEMLDLAKEHLQTVIKMSQNEDAHDQSEGQWEIKCEALEVRLKEAEREKTDKEHDDSKKKNRLFCFQGRKKKI
ncbi:uncharacterized protein LOC122873992 [Siniperca chuatsi]|uniref:uncharacterized protein LOC122873992 n=1 Tax=Siniperca chuatsi TaxID=119488 RepID=UPI001CE0906D|nr:uncharacterized protein LOC122873992 [Siniperca chuatsi]